MKKWRCKICGYIHDGERPPEICPVCGAGAEDFEAMKVTSFQDSKVKLKKIIIIGNGAAGIEAAKTIREKDKEVEIFIFTDEPYHFYSRIHLSTLIGDMSDIDDILIFQPSWYEEQKIQVFLDTPILSIHPEKKYIQDITGKTYEYDKLIIATGAHPFLPPIRGIEKDGVFFLRNLNDALNIRKFRQSCESAVIIGGGILGIEAASSLNKSGLDVTLVELADHLMPSQLDLEGANMLQHLLEKRGIQFRISVKTKQFQGNSSLCSVSLGNGEEIPAQLAIISTGISPNIEFTKEAGLQVNKGIIVNNNCQTNFPDIYAAGDVAEFEGKIFGIWPAAVDQGMVAGTHAIGLPTNYVGTLPLHILKVAGIELTALGQKHVSSKNESEIIHLDKDAGQYAKLIHDGEYLLGAIVLGIAGIGFRLERLIKKRKLIKELISHLEKGNWEILKQKK